MGNLTGDIKTIQNSRRGEDVRDAIIDALKIINSGTPATSLEGVKAEEFVKRADWENIFIKNNDGTYKLLDHVEAGSTKGVSSAAISELIDELKETFDTYILRSEKNLSEPLPDKIGRASEIVNRMCAAIRSRNPGSITTSTPLSEYPNAIANIEDKSDVKVASITITENGEYPKDDAKVVYNQVTVNVPANLIDNKTVNKLNPGGTLTLIPSSETDKEAAKKDGYKTVNINIGSQLQTLNLDETVLKTGDDTPVNLANSPFTIKASDKDDVLAFKEVNVDLKSKIADLEIAVDPEMDNGKVFNAENHDGIDSGVSLFGYRKVHISISEGKTTFTVTFKSEDGKKTYDTVSDVPKHGRAVYRKSKPTKAGHTFVGWVPNPVDVCEDMTVYANFEPDKDKTKSGEEAGESWEEITENGGVHVGIGSYKLLRVNACKYTYYDNANGYDIEVKVPATYYTMVKVAEGEGGTNSTWLSSNGIIGSFAMYTGDYPEVFPSVPPERIPIAAMMTSKTNIRALGWLNCDFRYWLNNIFLNSILTSKDKLNGTIGKNMIRKVSKYTRSFDTYTGGDIFYKTYDKIWIPSVSECGLSEIYEPCHVNYAEELEKNAGNSDKPTSIGDITAYRTGLGGAVGRFFTGSDKDGQEAPRAATQGASGGDSGVYPISSGNINELYQAGFICGEAHSVYIGSPIRNKYFYVGINPKIIGSPLDNLAAFNIANCTFSDIRFGFCI